MMGLDAMGVRMAMGLMASSGTGIRKNVGSAGKAFHVGNGVRAGLQAAALAANGFEVDPDVIEGLPHGHGHERFGLLESYAGPGNYELERIVKDLDGEFALTRIPTMVRMHPCSTVNCVLIDGMIELACRHDLRANDVKSIEIACHPRLMMIAPYAEPSDGYRAKFCPPYVAAAALVDRQVGLRQFTDARIADPEILSLMRRVRLQARSEVRADQSWCNGDDNWCAVRITIERVDGRTVGGRYSQAKGWPATPATWDDLKRKYEECTQATLSAANVRESIAMIANLSGLRSVRALVDLLRPGA
jgi:2-methylcitrate dehydratase PrpD